MWPRLALGWVLWLLAGLAWLTPRTAGADEPPSRVSVLTMGPGEHPFTRFGHNAILLEWDGQGPQQARVYNFGTFAFDGMNGVRDFMTGRFRYWLSVSNLSSTVRAYGRAGRSLTAQELALTRAERAELAAALVQNAEPARRYYDYDYYADNCSTRVRDAIDRALGGELSRSVHGSGRYTFRQHTLRLVAEAPLLSFGLDIALGRPTDRPITRWEELFLPQELHDELARAERTLGGQRVPLVRGERQLLVAHRPEPDAAPPTRAPIYGLLGGLAFATLFGLGRSAARSNVGRRLFGAGSLLLATTLGLLGTALLLFSISKHGAAHDNPSLLAVSPVALAVAWCSVPLLRGRPASSWLLRWLGVATAGCWLLLAWSLFGAGRESFRIAALFLPAWTGWLLGARYARRQA